MRLLDWAESYVDYLDVTLKYLLLVVKRLFPAVSSKKEVILWDTLSYWIETDSGAEELLLEPYGTILQMAYHVKNDTLVVLDVRGSNPWDWLLGNLMEGFDVSDGHYDDMIL